MPSLRQQTNVITMWKSLKRRILVISLFVLTGFFVFTTANVQQEVMAMFFGSLGAISLLTIIFFLAGMLQDSSVKEKIYPYAIVFALLVMWIIIFTVLRIVIKV